MTPMLYPINVNITKRPCLIVGGGSVAERKAISLLACKAVVRIVSPKFTKGLLELEQKSQVRLEKRLFVEKDLHNQFLVIAATSETSLNRRIAELCTADNRLVNVVDSPELSTFHVPSVHRSGMLTIAVSTGGLSPSLSAKIRDEIAENYGKEFEEYILLLGELRTYIKSSVADPARRKKYLNELVMLPPKEFVEGYRNGLIKGRIDTCLSLL